MAREMRVRDAMSPEVVEIPEDATLLAAARRMTDARVNSLIVRPEGKEDPFGIVTSTDLVDAIADGMNLSETQVSEVATAPLVTVTPGIPLAYAARLMKKTNLRHLAVFNGREIVGILSAFDMMVAVAKGTGGALRTKAVGDERASVAGN